MHIYHFPPGTTKWDKIEHRPSSDISRNWLGQTLVNLAAIVSLIGRTRSEMSLRARAELDRGKYPDGPEVTDEVMAKIRLEPGTFLGD